MKEIITFAILAILCIFVFFSMLYGLVIAIQNKNRHEKIHRKIKREKDKINRKF